MEYGVSIEENGECIGYITLNSFVIKKGDIVNIFDRRFVVLNIEHHIDECEDGFDSITLHVNSVIEHGNIAPIGIIINPN